ncbi:hypothetical protein HK405_012371, partial [Cladochytrium tenue]
MFPVTAFVVVGGLLALHFTRAAADTVDAVAAIAAAGLSLSPHIPNASRRRHTARDAVAPWTRAAFGAVLRHAVGPASAACLDLAVLTAADAGGRDLAGDGTTVADELTRSPAGNRLARAVIG